jgi:hypothetical protein
MLNPLIETLLGIPGNPKDKRATGNEQQVFIFAPLFSGNLSFGYITEVKRMTSVKSSRKNSVFCSPLLIFYQAQRSAV